MTTYNTILKNNDNNRLKKLQGELIAMMKKKRIKKQFHNPMIMKEQESDYVRFKLDAIKFLL